MQNVPSLIIWLPLLGFAYHAFLGKKLGNKAVTIVAPTVVLAAFAVTLWTLFNLVLPAPEHRLVVPLIPFTSPDTPWINFGGFRVNFALLLDPLSMLMAMIVTGVGGLIHIYATGYMAEDKEQPRFFTYFNLFIFMMLILVLGENFLMMFVGWEGVGTCSYLLISFWYTNTNNALAGNKAFIVNRVGDLGFALGMMAIWSVFGTLSFWGHDGHAGIMDMAKVHHDMNGQPFSNLPTIFGLSAITGICILLFIGAMGKSAQIPLWVWLPDAMAGPTPVSALIHAATMVTAGVVMLTRCSFLFVQAPQAMQFVAWIGLATAFMGATIGLVQNDIKRVLAFSTVSQLGYMFLACGVGNFTGGMFHVTTHAFFKALLFLGSGAVIHSMLGEQDMRKMGGLKKHIPRTWLVMLIGTIAIAGVPPLSGFWSKDEILDSASRSFFGFGPILYGVGLLTALMTAFYMWRLMAKTFDTEPRFVDGELPHQHQSNFEDEHDAHGHGHEEETPDEDIYGVPEPKMKTQEHKSQIHESPMSMMFPLYVLAFLSVVAGWILSYNHNLEHFLEPSVASMKDVGGLEEGGVLVSQTMGYIISTCIALLGIGIAWFAYNANKKSGQLVSESAKAKNPIFQFFYNKWLFDWGYNLLFIKFGGWFADKILWRTVDAGLIDGTVNTMAKLVGLISSGIRRSQTGYVRNYAVAMLFGAVLLVVGIFVTWNRLAPH